MTDLTSERGKLMLGYLPPYYQTSKVMLSIMQSEGTEFDWIHQALDEILNQFFAQNATWALVTWESELGLDTDELQPNNQRRDKITSRLRGFGTSTPTIVKKVAESYDKGSIEVIQDIPNYKIIAKFIDTTGVPPNLDDLKSALRAVVPSHLALEYLLNYFIYDDLDAENWTYDQLDALGLTYDELEVYG
jgi:hypothetical protein